MVDRIDKLKTTESWKIQETNPSKKDKRNQSEEEKQQDAKSSFEEKPDWNHLIAKESAGSGNLFTRDLKNISFKHTQVSHEEMETKDPSVNPEMQKAKSPLLPLSPFRNKTELTLLVITGILLLVLVYLISRFFIE